jgi:hypothetical protein
MHALRFAGDDAALDARSHVRIGAATPSRLLPALVIGAEPDIDVAPGLEAPTATEMALKVLQDGALTSRLSGVEVVTSAAYSGDHVLAAWVLCHPEQVVRREEAAISAARACVFGVCRTEAASQIAAFFRCFPEEAGEFAVPALFTTLIPKVADLLDRPRDFDLYWIGEYSDVIQADSLLHSGAVEFDAYPDIDLDVTYTPLRLHDLVRFTAASRSRLLTVRSENTYTLEFRRESWVRYPPVKPPPRVELQPLARRLAMFERADGLWRAGPIDEPVARLWFDDGRGHSSPSLIDAETVIAEVVAYLRDAMQRPELWWAPTIRRETLP